MTTYTWTTPTPFVVGHVETDSDLNPIFHDNMLFLYQIKFCRVFRSAVQSIPSSTVTAMSWTDEDEDLYSLHSTVSNQSRVVAPSGLAGIYLCHAQIEFAANATGTRSVFIEHNGTIIAQQVIDARSSGVTIVSVESSVKLAVGEYVEAFVSQTSGGSLNVDSGAATSFFEVEWIGNAT